MLIKTEQFDDAVWTKTAGGTGATPVVTANAGVAPDGSMTADRVLLNKGAGTTTADDSRIAQSGLALVVGGVYTDSVWIKSFDGVSRTVQFSANGLNPILINTTTEWQRVSITFTADVTSRETVLRLRGTQGTSDTADILVWGWQREIGTTATRYQRVNTATDYDWVGFPMYLKFDGVDDFLQTGSINFTATNKMVVVAGVTKLSDAVSALLVETSVDSNGNDGAFSVRATQGTGASGNYGVGGRGTVSGMVYQSTAGAQPAPHTGVLTGRYDFGVTNVSEQLKLSVNGVAQTLQSVIAGPTGVGNFGTYPMYIGRRGGTTLPFNGYLYQLGIRGALTEDAKLKPWERDTGNKTGVTLA